MKILKEKTSPKDFFLHLLAMVTLYASAVSFIVVIFQIINLTIPDTLMSGYYAQGGASKHLLRTGLSFLIVMFPTYIATSLVLYKSYAQDNSKRNLRVRKWLIYFTLFAAALIVLFTLVFLINRFLGGELTMRFFLKLITIMFVSGAIFGYYFWDIKKHHVR